MAKAIMIFGTAESVTGYARVAEALRSQRLQPSI
nr:MAG TPA: hypothetical protein [Caudoviricetes sp.]